MKVIAVITKPEEVRKILRHLVKIGRGSAPLRRPADPLRGWALPAGSELRVIANLSTACSLRGISMSPRHSLGFQ